MSGSEPTVERIAGLVWRFIGLGLVAYVVVDIWPFFPPMFYPYDIAYTLPPGFVVTRVGIVLIGMLVVVFSRRLGQLTCRGL